MKKYLYPSLMSKMPPMQNGKLTDDKCCTVMAIVHAFDMEFSDAHKICKDNGREQNTGMQVSDFCAMLFNVFFNKVKPFGTFGTTNGAITAAFYNTKVWGYEPKQYKGMTLSSFCDNFKEGTFIVFVKGHATVVKNGKIFSYSPENGNKRICAVWKVE